VAQSDRSRSRAHDQHRRPYRDTAHNGGLVPTAGRLVKKPSADFAGLLMPSGACCVAPRPNSAAHRRRWRTTLGSVLPMGSRDGELHVDFTGPAIGTLVEMPTFSRQAESTRVGLFTTKRILQAAPTALWTLPAALIAQIRLAGTSRPAVPHNLAHPCHRCVSMVRRLLMMSGIVMLGRF
jgi:hypothetical protein